MPDNFSRAITDAVLRRLAGEQQYERGLDYFTHGHVESWDEQDGVMSASVRGGRDYTITLTADDAVLDYTCDCPTGSKGVFCKHCVAAGLAWLAPAAGPAAKSRSRVKPKQMTLADAAKVLRSEDKEVLLRQLLEWAKDDGRLCDRLLLYAARRSGPESGVAAAGRAFQKAVRVRNFVHYREASGWAQDVDAAIDSIEQLLSDGQAAAVIELCEAALRSLVSAIKEVDDSDGHFAPLRDRLQDVHYRACQEARPDPVKLAGRLFQLELHSSFDVFSGAVDRYKEILGPEGMKAYRELAEAEWKKVPARTARHERSALREHFRITSIMESLARASGDVDELVMVMSRDLSGAYHYLEIAEVYREAGCDDSALEWAERGLAEFPERTDSRLREFAAEEYHRRGRSDDAMSLIWKEFHERPFLESFQTLERHATRAAKWPEWRKRAMAEIRLRIANIKQNAWGHSPLVEILLYEGDTEGAWREAKEGGCSESLWLRLAAIREKDHPEDAGPIYLHQAAENLDEIRNGRYQDTVDLLVKAAAAMKRANRGAEFLSQLEALLTKYKLKRNFLKLIEQNRNLLYA